jgi:hypothetical protein
LGYDFSPQGNNWTTNNISLGNTVIQSFTSSSTWTAPAGVTSVNYLVVAGGGSGGSNHGAGGGAGGMLTGTLTVVPSTSYTVTVGAGGTATAYGSAGNNGGNSVFGSITSTGGGAGGSSSSGGGSNGGSGGGATAFSPYNLYGTGIAGQGNNGGTSSSNETTHREAGGGGGAGAVGGNSNVSTGAAGNGGAGLASSISGSSVTYAGGGGGGCSAGFTTGTGGTGGGGNGANGSSNGGDGTANTGGGGGGGGGVSPATGGNGGSGIVIISYANPATSTNDRMTDVPTLTSATAANYCVLNPLDKNTSITASNGNLTATTPSGFALIRSTMFLTSDKYYWEVTCTTTGNGFVGISSASESLSSRGAETANSATISTANGNLRTSGSDSAYGSAISNGDVMIFALDMTSGKFWAGKNGTWFASGNPAAGTNAGKTGLTVAVSPSISLYDNENYSANFGQQPFAYTAPSGFVALNTFNL